MITKRSVKAPAARRPIQAATSITSGVVNRQNRQSSVMASKMAELNPAQRQFANQLMRNCRKPSAITAATNTSNIMARPDFLELLPMFVQKLLILDVYGSVAMRSRQQLVPYFKFMAENNKGETHAGDVLSSPFYNRQGIDPNFTGNVVKNEVVLEAGATSGAAMYTPILPGSVTIKTDGANDITDDGAGQLVQVTGSNTVSGVGCINYSTGAIILNGAASTSKDSSITYRYDNETVGPRAESAFDHGQYSAAMGKGYLQLDEFNLIAEARELACYWSIYSAFAAQQEYGSNIGDIAKEAAFSQITAEINSWGFDELKKAATFNAAFNWDASPVLSGSVVPSDYLNMFKLKLNQASAAIYQQTRLARPNRLIVGSNTAAYIGMINGFNADSVDDSVGPYKLGSLEQFEVYVDPNYDPNEWVMCCKSNDIRRNSALFGEYMPLTNTDPIGLANASVQQGYATMVALKVVNPATVVSGKILGTY